MADERIVYRVTAFPASVEETARIQLALGMIKGVGLVELLSVDEAKQKQASKGKKPKKEENMAWKTTGETTTTHRRRWVVGSDGQLETVGEAKQRGDPTTVLIVAEVIHTSSGQPQTVVKVSMWQPIDGLRDIHPGLELIRFGGLDTEDLHALFETAEEAARHLAMFYVTLNKATRTA